MDRLEGAFDYIDEHGFHCWLVKTLTNAYIKARKGKRATYDMHEFELHWQENIMRLAQAIEEWAYEPGSSISFVIFDPKVREIFAAPAKDRVIHHLLYDISVEWFDQQFIATSTSCRVGKGTLYAIREAQRQMLAVTENCTKRARIVKLDLAGYFMSLPRNKLCDTVIGGLEMQFAQYKGRKAARLVYALCKFLWKKVIMDDPVSKARKRGPRFNWSVENLPPNKSLYSQPKGYGVVIGNLTSQLISNIYLDRLDKFVTVTLGYRYYGRYVDDFYIMVTEEDYEQLKRDLRLIKNFLKDELGLILHPKKQYMQSVYKGMPYLGARIYPHCLYPSDRLQAKFRRAVLDYKCSNCGLESVVSYLGHMKHLDSSRFMRKVFMEAGWDYVAYLEFVESEARRPMADIVQEMARKI